MRGTYRVTSDPNIGLMWMVSGLSDCLTLSCHLHKPDMAGADPPLMGHVTCSLMGPLVDGRMLVVIRLLQQNNVFFVYDRLQIINPIFMTWSQPVRRRVRCAV